jgi:hypothetical protein
MIMRLLRIAAPLALGAALVAVAVASRAPASSPSDVEVSRLPVVVTQPMDDPVAHAGGADAAPAPLPSIVNVRLVRSAAALVRAAALVDQGQPSGAVVELNAAVLNMQKAWSAAQYIITTAPPPPVAEAGGLEAHASGAPVGASPTATPEDTAFAVLSLHHDVMTTVIGLIDGADESLMPAIDATISAAITARDDAITYIHSIEPPPPPVAEAGGVQAHASGAPVLGSTWAALMPGLVPHLDDEIQQATATLQPMQNSPIDLRVVTARLIATKSAINELWPPPVVPAD